MNGEHYIRVCRIMIVYTGIGMVLMVAFAMIAIDMHDWPILAMSIAAFVLNLMVCGIVIADGVRRFGDRHNG